MYILNCTCEREIEDTRFFWSKQTAKDIMIYEADEISRSGEAEFSEDGNSAWCENMNHDNCDWKISEFNISEYITPAQKQKAEQILIDNGIEEDEVQIVLQALGYALLDTELYPDNSEEKEEDEENILEAYVIQLVQGKEKQVIIVYSNNEENALDIADILAQTGVIDINWDITKARICRILRIATENDLDTFRQYSSEDILKD